MMDLQAYLIIVTVFFASLGFLLFINRQINAGKTFEEVLAEKRHLSEKLYGTNKKKKNTWKKSNKKKHEPKQQKVIHSSVESDTKSDSGDEDGTISNASSNEQNPKIHVEFTEADYIDPGTNTIEFKRQLSASKLLTGQQSARKISTSKSPGSGILVNKQTSNQKLAPSPPPPPPTNHTVESLNNFDKIHPKDDLEIKKQRDESVGRITNNSKKEKGGKHKKEHFSAAIVTKAAEQTNDLVDVRLNVPLEQVAQIAVIAPKESPKNVTNKEKANKKKRNNAALVQQLVDAGVASSTSEAVNVNAIMKQLGRTELSRDEIQILIDFLLNKQQDSANGIHSDWSDDPMSKMRKQMEETNRLLSEEQATVQAIQTKLRELRTEYNAERQQSHHRQNAHIEEINTLKVKLNQALQDHQLFVEQTTSEKQKIDVQLQHLQQKLYQESQKNSQAQETAQKLQQLNDTNAQLSAELLTKNNLIQDMNNKLMQIHEENSLHKKAINDYEQRFEELLRSRETDTVHFNNEMQRLRTECQRKEEIEKLFAIKKYEFEQLEARLTEQSKQSNQIEDSSKVEIRNLQNALDSTKTELQLARNELADSKINYSKCADELDIKLANLKADYETEQTSNVQKYTKQIEALNGSIQSYRSTIGEKEQMLSELQAKLDHLSSEQREQELFKQIADYKEKNNELRKKNWKLVDALQKAEESAFKISTKCKLVTVNATISPSKLSSVPDVSSKEDDVAEQQYVSRTKEVFERLFPSIASNVDYDIWLQNLCSQIEQLQQQSQQNSLKQKTNATNHQQQQQNGGDDDNNVDEGEGEDEGEGVNGTHNHGQDNGIKITPSTEELILQNAQLKSTVDSYKNIVADTEGVLNNLEMKVKEQDAYWRSIVQVKDNEIRSLKQNDLATT